MSRDLVLVGAWVSPEVKKLCEKMSKAQGRSLSGYLRSLIISDLDKRTFFTTQVKLELEE